MNLIYFDACVLIDATNEDSPWNRWAVCRLENIAKSSDQKGVISPVAVSEVLAGYEYDQLSDVAGLLETVSIEIRNPCLESLHIAGRKHLEYRREHNGQKLTVLPDFFIGAQAAVDRAQLVTRDTKRFKTYFPSVSLVFPH